MTNSPSLRKKMQFSFLSVSAFSIFIVILFSLTYFYLAVRQQAAQNMREKIEIAAMIYRARQESVQIFTQNLAANKALQVLLDLDIRNKLSEFIIEIVNREKTYQIIVFNEKSRVLANVAVQDSLLIRNEELIPLAKNQFALAALRGESPVSTELVRTQAEPALLTISAAHPVYRDNKLIGGVLVRLVLNQNPSLVREIRQKLHLDAAIIESANAIAKTAPIDIDANLYLKLIKSPPPPDHFTESIRIWFGGKLTQFRVLRQLDGSAIGVLAIQDSADRFVQTFVNALFISLGIMAATLVLAGLFVYLVSRSIIVPINELLQGVNKITDGDLSYEIYINLKDEIGRLSKAFNDMRLALRDKITTIEELNENLEGTVKERTHTIESLLESMKKYLPLQLFDAIVGGQRTNDIHAHYRKRLTIFFSDIVNFTSTTESMEAEDLSDLLNNYLDNMAKIANKWGGTIDKFIGDAVMIFFGDPEYTNDADHALRAVQMSLEMLDKMNELRRIWIDRGIQQPLHIRIGVNTGYCTVGNFGSENRMDYTIIGGNVNLAQRLESAAQPDTILISHETYSLVKNQIHCELSHEMVLKGISHPVRTYRVIGERNVKKNLDVIEVKPAGIVLKDSLLDPATMHEEDRQELIQALTTALHYAEGALDHNYDERLKTWKLVKRPREAEPKATDA